MDGVRSEDVLNRLGVGLQAVRKDEARRGLGTPLRDGDGLRGVPQSPGSGEVRPNEEPRSFIYDVPVPDVLSRNIDYGLIYDPHLRRADPYPVQKPFGSLRIRDDPAPHARRIYWDARRGLNVPADVRKRESIVEEAQPFADSRGREVHPFRRACPCEFPLTGFAAIVLRASLEASFDCQRRGAKFTVHFRKSVLHREDLKRKG